MFFFAFLACFLSTAYVPLCFRAIFLSVRLWKTVALSISLRVELAETYEAAFWKAINLRHADENAQHYLCMFAVLLVPLTLGVLKKRLTPGVLNKRLTLGVLKSASIPSVLCQIAKQFDHPGHQPCCCWWCAQTSQNCD